MMVAPSMAPLVVEEDDTDIPVIDLSAKRGHVSIDMVRACEEFGFFKVVGHGVPAGVVHNMEAVGLDFFSLPSHEKHRSGPPNPLGYGSRSIGSNGDAGDVEYLLLHATPHSVSVRANTVCPNRPEYFSNAVNEYVDAVKGLGCEVLGILGEGLGLEDREVFSSLVGDRESDSLVRFNHYPGRHHAGGSGKQQEQQCSPQVGFGEHTDPQVLTVLRSNDVAGLQILSTSDGESGRHPAWVPVPPDPDAFFVNVGDTLQALTNGRLVSVRHRAMTNSYRPRLSIVYFAAPALSARIAPLPEMITPSRPRRYRPFTWGEYKKAVYSLRLAHDRLHLFSDNRRHAPPV